MIKIEKHTQISVPIDLVNKIEQLLKILPPGHLAGVEKVVLVDSVYSKIHKKVDIEGIYRGKRRDHPAYIEIAIGELVQQMPRALYYFPYFWRYLLAKVLYHEVGHHYMQSLHGIKKEEWESFAERYMRQMLRKAFPGASRIAWLIYSPRRILRKAQKRRKDNTIHLPSS